MLDARMIYHGIAKPEKAPSEMNLKEWAFYFNALKKIREEEQKANDGK